MYVFTPACRIILEMVGTDHGRDIVRGDDILLETGDLSRYLRMATLEE